MRARRFGDFEDRLWELRVELSDMMPRPRPTKQKPEGNPDKIDYWAEMVMGLKSAAIAAWALRYRLERKAGMDAVSLQRQREEARCLQADEGGATEEATQAAT
jgi:hypothetical protein